ncbi:MAG TPA: TlpA disulfide reductase family protein [Dissulfurispiraceae bacterium]
MKGKGVILLIILAIGIAAVVVLTKTESVPKKAAVGLEAPAFELKDMQGRPWKLSDFKGKTVLLNFWASWCDSCKEENPSLQRLIDMEKGNARLVPVTVLFRDDPAKAAEYMKANGISFPVLLDDKNIALQYGLTGVPETFIIDSKGVVRQKIVGPIAWDAPEVKAALDKLSNE